MSSWRSVTHSSRDAKVLCLLTLSAGLVRVIEPLLRGDGEANLQRQGLYGEEVVSGSCHCSIK